MSPRPALPPGTWGSISVSGQQAPYKARARVRDWNGHLVSVARFGQTKTAARNSLLAALRDFQDRAKGSHITSDTTVEKLAELWLAEGRKASGELWAPNTLETYRYIVANEVTPALGGLRLGELRLALINRALEAVARRNGSSAAKTMKTALSGMCQLAIRHEALDANPMRDAIRIARDRKQPVRALTPAEVDDLTDKLRADPQAVQRYDLADLVEWMLGTGCRIGEALAARDTVLDLDAGTWEINATVIRVKGAGLRIQEWTKTEAGWRVLALPPYCVALLRRRADELRIEGPHGVVFPAPSARALRDPSNTAGDLRDLLDRVGCPSCGGDGWHAHLKTEKQNATRPKSAAICKDTPPFAWVTSHTFRKTVLTRLDDAGLTARQIADYAGHAKPSMTQDVYMGRNVVSADAARILDR